MARRLAIGLWAQCDFGKAKAKGGKVYGKNSIPETASVKLELMLLGVFFSCG